jgi:hypothetical protein
VSILVLSRALLFITRALEYFIRDFKVTLKSIASKLENSLHEEIEKHNNSDSTDTSLKSRLDDKLKTMRQLWNILFLVQIHIPLGIENDRFISAYEQIQNLVL